MNKIIYGIKNNKPLVLVGCGCGALVSVCGIAIVVSFLSAPKLMEQIEEEVALEQERQKLTAAWNPPAPSLEDHPLDELFPIRIGAHERDSLDDDAAIPEFGFELAGHRAVYINAESRIEVFAYPTSELEKEALFQRLDEVYEEDEGTFKRKTNMGYRLYYNSSQHHQNHFWWTQGWLLVFRTQDSEDREPFALKFFASAPAPADSAPAAETGTP